MSPAPPILRFGPPSRRLAWVPISLLASAAIAACGSSSGAASTATTSGRPSAAVAVVDSDVTAQMVAAAARPSAHANEATFTLRALTASGSPAAGEPVSWWVGPMVPLSGVHPAHWYEAGTSAAAPYVATATAKTNAAGQARIVLLGQPAKRMEMVAVRVGDLSSYDTALGRGLGLLDAWWTTPSTSPTAPVGDRVTVTPFLAQTRPGARTDFQVKVANAAGAPIVGAGVSWTPSKVATGSGMGMGSSSTAMGSSMSAAPAATTNAAGTASFAFSEPKQAGGWSFRAVVTQPGSARRIAGGMAGQLFPAA